MHRIHEVRRDRREILYAAGAAALLAAVHAALGRGDPVQTSGQDSSRVAVGIAGPDPAVDLASAWKRAGALGKPLLVILVPERSELVWGRQVLFGGLLRVGSKEVLADLAMCEIACARKKEVCDLIGLEPIYGDPPAVLVESQTRPPRGRLIEPGPVEERAIWFESRFADGTRARALLPESSEGWKPGAEYNRAEALARAIRAALVGDAALLARRAADAGEQLPRGIQAEMATIASSSTPPSLAMIERAAAIVRAEAESHPDSRERLIDLLAQAASARWVQTPPPGARWARNGPCGLEIQDPEKGQFGSLSPCGMAMTPPLSLHFLYFYSQH